jgi:hypothetical protein
MGELRRLSMREVSLLRALMDLDTPTERERLRFLGG